MASAAQGGDDAAITVLLVDDDEEDALLTRDLLDAIEGTRYAPRLVDGYAAALAAAGESSYDVCLVDYRLGAEDGIALVRELIARDFDTPIVVLTGLGDREVDVEATTAGASDYLVKGEVTPALLERTIRYAIRRHEDMRALRNSAEELRQGQRMEAVGRFAGGVAHDFNNMMSAVVGFSELVLAELADDDPLRRYVAEIHRAGERASGMANQLLAFTRKQVLLPQVLDLNELVLGIGGLLAPLIGEDVELVTDLAEDIHPVEADVSQLEQVVVNLAVNARDAMPGGGRLTIATANLEVAEEDAGRSGDLGPGPYAALTVADTGEGMDAETLRQIFEPFFTTKDEGKGTGLGLATAFGIVKQSGGDIRVESERGRGTTVTICLPRAAETLPSAPPPPPPPRMRGGSETILLVEDEALVRQLALEVLAGHGYQVLEAAGPEQALEIARTHAGEIHLLLTDVVMPGMSGDRLATQLIADRPELRVVFASGYTADAFAERGILAHGHAFLPKPLTPAAVVQIVRTVLDDALPRRRAS